MTFEVIKKRQSIYILVVTLVIASLSFLTIHGINSSINTSIDNTPSINTETDTKDTHILREGIIDKPELLNVASVSANSEQPLTAAGDAFCKIAGCNKELCIPVGDNETVSSCKNTEANKCYVGGDCRIQSGGKCGWSVNATVNRCLADSNFATQDIRVLQINYITDPNDIPYNPNSLGVQLGNIIKDSSTFHKYKDTLSKAAVNVKIVDTINVDGGRENVENYWYGQYYKMIQEFNICQRVKDEKIDQIWMWVDPRDPSQSPGLEYVISSKFFLKNNNDAGSAKPPFCEGDISFAIMGFDYTRPVDSALHSFGHYMESILNTTMNPDLFGKYEGNFNVGIQGRYQCGNVHFPPNGTSDYDYANSNTKPTYCENWDPNLDQNSAILQSYNCNRWGCSQQGYMTWWLQNMPGFNSPLIYQGRKIPSWWDFTVGFDAKVRKYMADPTVYIDNYTLGINDVDLSNDCSCSGFDENNQAITVNTCWQNIKRPGGVQCQQCTKDTFYQVPNFFCDP
ncbi:MAG: hypothetical protein ABIM99_05210 [Candidatus Dojkabacteria bacterium]